MNEQSKQKEEEVILARPDGGQKTAADQQEKATRKRLSRYGRSKNAPHKP